MEISQLLRTTHNILDIKGHFLYTMVKDEKLISSIGLLAVLISILYAANTSELFGYIAGVSSVIIVLSIYYMFKGGKVKQ